MTLTLKERTKTTLAGVISITFPMVLLTAYHGTEHFESVAALSVAICCLGSYYQGATTADRINAETKEYYNGSTRE